MILKVIIFLSLFFLLAGTVSSAQDEDSNIFGVVEGFWLPDVVCELNPGWERIIFDWSQHQPTGPDDWHTLNVDDRWLAAARDCNREVVAVVKHTPDWATKGTPGPGLPEGLYLPVDDPGNYWAGFMRRMAEYYEPRGVSRFIIWNEPDISRETYGFEFEGSLEDYFQLLKVAYLALKQGNPDAEILLAGTTYWHDVNAGQRLYVDRLLERIMADPDAPQHDYYFNVISLHIYFRSETVYDIVRSMRGLLDQYGLTEKRIWITETNAGPTDDPLWPVIRPQYQIDLGQQSAFLMQAVTLGLAGGAERIAVYKFYDWNLPPNDETFGLLRADQSRRPAFDTWAAVIRELNGVEQANFAQTDSLDAVRLSYAGGDVMFALWARTASQVSVEVSADTDNTILLDQYGNVLPLDGLNHQGWYRISLDAARCDEADGCAVGGNVKLLRASARSIVREITPSGVMEINFE